jgi:hypothetical protein
MPSVPRRMGLRERSEGARKPGRGESCHNQNCFRKERGYELRGGKATGTMLGVRPNGVRVACS